MECVKDGKSSNGGVNPTRYPSQILCLAEQILFTERCEQAMSHNALTEFMIELESQLDSYTSTDIQVSVHVHFYKYRNNNPSIFVSTCTRLVLTCMLASYIPEVIEVT